MPDALSPPRLAEALLRLLVRDHWDTHLGDFEEWFHLMADERGPAYARRWYWSQVLKMLPDRLHERLYLLIAMFKNYFVIALRNLRKNKAAAGINIVGLSLAVGCSLVAFLFIESKLVRDTHHPFAAETYLVEQQRTDADGVHRYGVTPTALAGALRQDVPGVERVTRSAYRYAQVQRDERWMGNNVRFADPDFFELFDVPLASGTYAALTDPQNVVLSADAAVRFFGDGDPLGQPLTMRFGNAPATTFMVGAVAEPFHPRTDFRFGIAGNIAWVLAQESASDGAWADYTHTFVQIPASTDTGAVLTQLDAYLAPQRAALDAEAAFTPGAFGLVPLSDIRRQADEIEQSPVGGLPWAPIIVLSVISIFLLTLACLNFVNIALSAATRRMKEIGVRKTMGGSRGQLIAQFLTENVLLACIAMVFGTVLAAFFLLPAFVNISSTELSIGLTESLPTWAFLAGLLVVIGLVAGAYPAFYISRFQPVHVFRGAREPKRGRWFMHGFLTLQFVLAFITTIASLTFVLNERHLAERDWGYDPADKVAIHVATPQAYQVMRTAAEQHPDVAAVTASEHHVGEDAAHGEVHIDGEPFVGNRFDVAPEYLDVLALRFVAGHSFDSNLEQEPAIVINEAFATANDWTEPLGKIVRVDSVHHAVVGVVADFHHNSFFDSIGPMFFVPADEAAYAYLTLAVTPGTAPRTAEAMKAAWATLYPNVEMRFIFQEDAFVDFFRESEGITNIFVFVALLALLISCMGLFGLFAQYIAGRMKEVGVRKVLGASAGQLVRLVNRRFVALLVLAAVIASPLSYQLVQMLLGSIYTYHLDVNAAPFLLAFGLIFSTALLTIAIHLRRVIRLNPADVLRDE